MRKLAVGGLVALLAAVALPTVVSAEALSATPPTVEVLDPGAQPRRLLRFAPHEGAVETSVMTMTMKIRQSGVISNSIGPIRIRVDTKATVAEVLPDGSFRITFEYPSFELLTSKGYTRAQKNSVQATFDSMSELSGDYTMAPSGAVLDSHFDIPDTGNEVVGQLLQQLSSQVTGFNPPFPSDPVGEGAQWRTTAEASPLGVVQRSVSTYTLRHVDGKRLEISVSTDLSADRGAITLPGAPADVSAELVESTGSGGGTSTVDLTQVFPDESRSSTKGHQELRITQGSDTAKIVQDLAIALTLKPRH